MPATEYHYQYDAFGRPCRISYQNSGGTTVGYCFTQNTRGDVEEIYNANGALQARYIYDAWGKTVSVQNASGTEISSQTHIAPLFLWPPATNTWVVGEAHSFGYFILKEKRSLLMPTTF
ncbi:MAG: hypothetical protein FWG40_12835 [Peptococcaceae bacterium]|nr:hypothetical protein [Peptococcaceae bacterium]